MAQTESPIEVANEYVTVRKAPVETEKEGVLGIELRFSTDADGLVDVRVVEQLPDFVSMQDVGLHPGYQPRNWTIHEDERRLVYEDLVSPDDELVTLYGILTERYDDLGAFLGEPVIEHAAPAGDDAGSDASSVFGDSLLGGPANGESGASGGRSSDGEVPDEPAADAADAADEPGERTFVYKGEERSSLLGPDDGPSEDDPSDTDPSDADPSDGDRAIAEAAERVLGGAVDRGDAGAGGGTDAGDAGPDGPVGAADGSVVSALLDEIEDGDVDDDRLGALREALGVETPDSVGVRLSHLQSEVATLSAFAEEFESFVDSEGGLDEVVGDLREGLRSVEDEVEALSADVGERLDDVDGRMKRVRGRLRDVDDVVDDLADDVESAAEQREALREAHEADVDRLDGRLVAVEGDHDEVLETVRAHVEALDDELDAERRWRRTVVDSLGDIVDRSFEDDAGTDA